MKKHRINVPKTIAIAAAIAAAIAIYSYFDPAEHPFPRCPVLVLAGVQCPGCGSQRALHALFTGDIATAWRMNAMLVASIPALLLTMVASVWKHRYPKLYNALNSSTAIYIWLVLLLSWTIVRNIVSIGA